MKTLTITGVALALALAALGGGVIADNLDDGDEPAAVTIDGGSAAAPAGAGPGSGAAEVRRDRNVRALRLDEDDDDDDLPLSVPEAERAIEAALAAAGGGSVTELERSDDPGEAYEVEVVNDGLEVDVALDADFQRVRNRRHDD